MTDPTKSGITSASILSENGKDIGTRLLATGFNAHGQLSSDTNSDILSFVPICETYASDLRVLFAGWSQTLIVAEGGVLCLGQKKDEAKSLLSKGNNTPRSAVGDVNGLLLTLGASGDVRLMSAEKFGDEDSPQLGHIAVAQNGRVAFTSLQAPAAQLCHVMEFNSFERFRKWFQDPSGNGNYPDRHHMLAGRPKQLLANAGTFMLLMDRGELYTWGDARYGSLGRTIAGEDAVMADAPGNVEALGGLKIVKIATSGWICAALSEDRACYLWGTTSPGSTAKIGALRSEAGGDVALVEIAGGKTDEPLDVLDVGVGDDHIAVVAEGNRLFVVGENNNGQLGLGGDVGLEDWREILHPGEFRAVWCGPLCTFALVNTG